MPQRDVEFRILTKLEDAELRRAAEGFDDLTTASDDASRSLQDTGRQADTLELDQLGDDAREAAREVDAGFDAMARSADTGARKIDREADGMRRSLRDVGDEAGDTAREAAASFGSTGDIGDALQEVAANAPATLGPLGLAFGSVAAIGVGLFRTQTEKLKERVSELTEEMIAGAGRLSAAFIDAQLQQLASAGELDGIKETIRLYDIAGVTYRDVARAKAGEQESIDRVTAALAAETSRRKTSADEMGKSEAAVAAIAALFDDSARATDLAREASGAYADATVIDQERAQEIIEGTRDDWDTLRGSMVDPITGKVRVDKPSSRELANIRLQMQQGIGPIVVDVYARPKYDQSTFSRYRP